MISFKLDGWQGIECSNRGDGGDKTTKKGLNEPSGYHGK